jgi:radical SAM superfamily enzyme YgiQ (UPF0313 family)
MKILFIDTWHKYLGRYNCSSKISPSLGLVYVATYIKEQGHDVCFYDVMLKDKKGISIESVLISFEPDIVAMTATTPFIPVAYQIAKTVKQLAPNSYIVLGGPHASALPSKCIDECSSIDYIVIGEGELSFSELVCSLRDGKNEAILPGVLGRNFKLEDVQPRKLINNLDNISFPDWSLVNYSNYEKIYSYRLERIDHLYQLQLSRGCPFRCSFCFNIFESSFRSRSVLSVLDEIKLLYSQYGARLFEFIDPNMTLDAYTFAEFCTQIIETGLQDQIAWNFQTRCDLVNFDLLSLAKNAGCESVLFGVESGSQEILNKTEKEIDLEQAYSAIRTAANVGLKTKVTLIIGNFYETQTTLDQTMAFVKKIKSSYDIDIFPSFLGIYPKTKAYFMAENNQGGARWVKGIQNNWELSSRNRPMIEVNDLNTSRLQEFMRELKAIINYK